MTCREKLAMEHPDCVGQSYYIGGCHGCPHDYGYLDKPDYCNAYSGDCTACWDREIPGTEPLTYEYTSTPIGKVTELTTNDNGVTAKIELNNEKEKNMATTKKTKAELEKELENIKESKAELEKELKNLEKYKQYEECADELKALHTAFINSGFSDEQAFDLLKMMTQTTFSQQFTKAVLRR